MFERDRTTDETLCDRTSTPDAILAELRSMYRPFDTMPAFDEGFAAYDDAGALRRHPYDDVKTLTGQVSLHIHPHWVKDVPRLFFGGISSHPFAFN